MDERAYYAQSVEVFVNNELYFVRFEQSVPRFLKKEDGTREMFEEDQAIASVIMNKALARKLSNMLGKFLEESPEGDQSEATSAKVSC